AEAVYKESFAAFRPKFKDYQVVVSNYNGDLWPATTRSDFAEFVSHGGGFVAVHAANNSFPEWPEYNAMIGVGGWGGAERKIRSVRPAARRQVHPRHVQGSGWGPRSATRFPGGSARCGTPDYQGATTEVDARAGRTLRTSPRPGRTPDRARDRVRRPEEGRQQRARADAHGDRVRQGSGVPRDARARPARDAVRRLPHDVRPRHRVGRDGKGDDPGPVGLPDGRNDLEPPVMPSWPKSPDFGSGA